MDKLLITSIDGVEIATNLENVTKKELSEYVKIAKKDSKYPVRKMEVMAVDGENVSLEYSCIPPQFERVRRITGYLVGTTDRWNDSKRAELKDRVKHNLSGFGR